MNEQKPIESQPVTDLDKKLQEIALKNWQQFVALIGVEAITCAKMCLMRQRNMTYGQIQNKLGVTKNQVEYQCRKCEYPEEIK